MTGINNTNKGGHIIVNIIHHHYYNGSDPSTNSTNNNHPTRTETEILNRVADAPPFVHRHTTTHQHHTNT
jgi:hypothetical protein